MTKKQKDPYHFYETPQVLTEVLNLVVPIHGIVLECCSGENAIAKLYDGCYTNDLDPTRPAQMHFDARTPLGWQQMISFMGGKPDWVVTNPPFPFAIDILENAMLNCNVGVAFLLRTTFHEPTFRRASWLKKHAQHLPYRIIFGSPRPGFTGKGTDMASPEWNVWTKNPCNGTKMIYCDNWRDM